MAVGREDSASGLDESVAAPRWGGGEITGMARRRGPSRDGGQRGLAMAQGRTADDGVAAWRWLGLARARGGRRGGGERARARRAEDAQRRFAGEAG